MKKLFVILGVVLALVVPFAAFAATSDAPAAQAVRCFCGIDTSTLTDQQKADLNDQFEKMADLRKETVKKMVADGTLTQEEGNAWIARIDSMAAARQQNGLTCGMGMGRGHGGGYGMGRGFRGGFNPDTAN